MTRRRRRGDVARSLSAVSAAGVDLPWGNGTVARGPVRRDAAYKHGGGGGWIVGLCTDDRRFAMDGLSCIDVHQEERWGQPHPTAVASVAGIVIRAPWLALTLHASRGPLHEAVSCGP